ncbi:MAG TPA: helix-turn-helix transcriptional regulator [Chitinophagaceae bacterium]|nr:helix-turn-helix transcriptional regulator [Chitinophagaceae bacterium]
MRYTDNNLTAQEANEILRLMGQRIKAQRLSKNLSQLALSKQMNIQKASLSRIESGKMNIKVYSLHRLAMALHTHESALLAKLDHADAHSYESLVLLQAQYRRYGDTLTGLQKEIQELFASIAATKDFRQRASLHIILSETFAKRTALLQKLKSVTDAMHLHERP